QQKAFWASSISFRSASGCVFCQHDLIISLVSQLAAYTEEGTPLAPAVFICNSIDELIGMAGTGERVSLSETVDTVDAAVQILKYAAPLCTGGWNIYVERLTDGRQCKFGVFSGPNDPSSLSVDQLVLGDLDPSFPVLRISQNVVNKVEVRVGSTEAIEFRFNDDIDADIYEARSNIQKLARSSTRSAPDKTGAFCEFMERLLDQSIKKSHGTLIAVVPAGISKIPDELTDVVKLETPIDLFERYQLHIDEGKSAISVGRLHVALELLAGFVNSDGITVLGSDGKILGYRAFISSKEGVASGGARSRAFAALSALVGGSLECAFFRSQDGRIDGKFSEEAVK
ncbi:MULTISPECIES: hypothetical protein, partial [unclassified Yoonia]|uniref:hypothetical protein n=1 Tax=unclassified Yoonia TaxID=2629118 RepID=UPI002B001733